MIVGSPASSVHDRRYSKPRRLPEVVKQDLSSSFTLARASVLLKFISAELRAGPVPSWQDPPKKHGQKIHKRKGGLNMKKIITIMCGWAFFISGILMSEPTYYKVLLLSVARVLPSALLI